MISIPIAANIPAYRHQLSLFWENHINVYGLSAKDKAHAVIVLQKPTIPKWDIDIPHTIVNSWSHCHERPQDSYLAPLNIQVGLQQVLHKFDDDEVLELIDCDMFHLRKAPQYEPGLMEFIANDIYENWHLHSRGRSVHIIEQHLKTNNFYNGGFVPIIGRAKTFKTIIEDWIDIHLDIYDSNENQVVRWWAGMYSFQAACANNGIKMVSEDNCYIPRVNALKNWHYIAHYCCDEKYFNKKIVLENPQEFDASTLPNNLFYNRIKEYFSHEA